MCSEWDTRRVYERRPVQLWTVRWRPPFTIEIYAHFWMMLEDATAFSNVAKYGGSGLSSLVAQKAGTCPLIACRIMKNPFLTYETGIGYRVNWVNWENNQSSIVSVKPVCYRPNDLWRLCDVLTTGLSGGLCGAGGFSVKMVQCAS